MPLYAELDFTLIFLFGILLLHSEQYLNVNEVLREVINTKLILKIFKLQFRLLFPIFKITKGIFLVTKKSKHVQYAMKSCPFSKQWQAL